MGKASFIRSSLASKVFAVLSVGSMTMLLSLSYVDVSRYSVRGQYDVDKALKADRLSTAFSSLVLTSRDRQLLTFTRNEEEQRTFQRQLLAEYECFLVDSPNMAAPMEGYRRHVEAVGRNDWDQILQTITADDREQLERVRSALVGRKQIEHKYALLNVLQARLFSWPGIDVKASSLVGFCQRYSEILRRALFSDLFPFENKCSVNNIDDRTAAIRVLSAFGVVEVRMTKENGTWRCNLFNRQFLSQHSYATLGLSSVADDGVSLFLKNGHRGDWKSLHHLLDASSRAWLADLAYIILKSRRADTTKSPRASKWMESLIESIEGIEVNSENILSALLTDVRFITPIATWSTSGIFYGDGSLNISRRHSLVTIYVGGPELKSVEEFLNRHIVIGVVDEGGQAKVCLADLFLVENEDTPAGVGLDDPRIKPLFLSRRLSAR